MYEFTFFKLYSLLLFTTLVMPGKAEEFKLSDDVIPSSQIISLTLDPASSNFSGKTTLTINIIAPRKNIKLYSKNLLINSAILTNDSSEVTLAVVGTNGYDITTLSSDNSLAKGEYQLSLSFKGKYSDTGQGLFKVTANKDNYLFTQFQSMLARTVFPSFDQPNFKIQFQFQINVPAGEGYLVISNTPQKTRAIHDGWDRFTFEPTQPIYTDVLAFAVGKFDVIDIPNMPVPSKLYVVKSKLPKTAYAIKNIGVIFKEVKAFFSLEYPYKKLDMVAVPHYANAAMEHVGLVYFKEYFILLDETSSIGQQKYTLKLIAHEIAHMWFGNLVTMQWWNDLWLNESFAEWLAHKTVIATFPELSAELDLPQTSSLSDDNVNTQLAIRRTVKSKSDADSMGDIAYSKGNAILNMVEQYVGEAVFREAVIAYLLAYQHKNATLQDFVKHIETASEKQLAGFFSAFLEQPGFPLLSLQVKGDRLLISQQPFGVNARDQDKKSLMWQVPLIIKFIMDDRVITQHVFLDKQTMELAMPKGVKAIFPDAKAIGYYRYLLPDKDELFIQTNISLLDDNEKLAWLDNNEHLTKIDERAYADVLALKLALLSDVLLNKKVASDIIRDINFSYTDFIPEAISEKYSHYITTHLAVRLTTVNWSENTDNTAEENSLKASLLTLAGSRLGDIKAIKFAVENYQDILSEQSSLDSSMSKAVLAVIAANYAADEYALFEKAYLTTTDTNLKSRLLNAMGSFPSPTIVTHYYDFLLSGEVPTDEIAYRFQYPAFNPVLRHHAMDYIAVNKDKILAHINQQQWFPYTFYTSCEEDIRERVTQVFSTWVKDVPGLKEKLNTVDETIKQCIHSRAKIAYSCKSCCQK